MPTEYIRVDIPCPKCNDVARLDITALVDSGLVPDNDFACAECGQRYRVHADISIDISEIR